MVFVQILKKWLPVFGTLERVVRDDEPVMRLPGVHPEAALLASAQHELTVIDLEALPETALHLALTAPSVRAPRLLFGRKTGIVSPSEGGNG